MFDARSILDALVRGGGQPQGQGPGQGTNIFGDLLGQLGNQPGVRSGTPQPTPQARVPASDPRGGYQNEIPGSSPPGQSGGGGLEDLLRSVLGAGAPAGQGPGAGGPGGPGGGSLEELLRSVLGGGAPAQQGPGSGGRGGPGAGSLQDMLRDLLGSGGAGGPMNRMVGEGGQGGGGQAGPGAVLDVLKQVLGQATSGVREGAGRLDDATGASGHARDAIGQATGKSPEELIAQLKELIANNKLGAGAALGGLGALILGSGAGRALAGSAIKMGGLALIGGLAYKAYQNYQQGLPPLTGGKGPTQQSLVAAPKGSGFEADAVTHESAMLYISAMIAAADADGRIDAKEQQKILGGLQQAGMNADGQQFLTKEINNPATVEELAAAVSSPEEAVQVYTAARVAVDVDTDAEHEFLVNLAKALGIDDHLAAQVDAAARAAAA